MQSWCSPTDVDDLVEGSAPIELLQEMADHATSLLYSMSGRRYRGVATVESVHEINRRGYASLTAWLPVNEIVSATIDGRPVTAALSPAGSYATFPRQHAGKFVTLTLSVGQNPPPMAEKAAAALAAELLRGDSRYEVLGASDVRHSSRITSIARQGVTVTYTDPSSMLDNNMTGVYAVDLFLRAVNPTGARFQPKVVTT
jgi:hypothetical protein